MSTALHGWSLIVPMRKLTSDQDDGQSQQEVCVTNISPEERRKRLRIGLVYLAITLTVLVAMIVMGINPLWRLMLYGGFSAAASTVFQWRDKT